MRWACLGGLAWRFVVHSTVTESRDPARAYAVLANAKVHNFVSANGCC